VALIRLYFKTSGHLFRQHTMLSTWWWRVAQGRQIRRRLAVVALADIFQHLYPYPRRHRIQPLSVAVVQPLAPL
jgi:hypothetical protein